ncbi:hypothetical protein EMPS_11247 [Entomortierella parvispora]|uniref:Uncharacterized protein n=1 Tax=Entomortierella parvispora TaxID=205924 RepID=A0A9P3HM65_9FUNG|nr:hypothetical protein EMPS_11247 [Entomortierella parvispora]
MQLKFLSVTALALAAACMPLAQSHPTQRCTNAPLKIMTVFGDSYSDTGNEYRLSNKTWPLPWYYKGRFSNGKVWSEHVAKDKHYELRNYAYAGATTDSTMVQGYSGADGNMPVPGFIQQVQTYLDDHHNHASPNYNELFVIDFQGNDYVFNPEIPTKSVLDRLKTGLERLVRDAGARQILVVENINFGLVPELFKNATLSSLFSSIAAEQWKDYKDDFAVMMKSKYGAVQNPQHPFDMCRSDRDKNKVHIGYFRIADLFKELYKPASLKRLGITDVVHGCVSNDYKTLCKDAGEHFYWDAFHVTEKIQIEVAKAVEKLL